MERALVETQGLGRIFRRHETEVVVLRDINMEVRRGEFVALTGPSGSGKTTLLNIIAGLDQPTSGAMRVGELEVQQMSEDQLAEWRNEQIGFVFQDFNLIPVLTALENVELPLLLTDLSKKERRKHALTALGVVGLSDRVEHYPRQLSGGQEQRVAIARAIVTDPTLILADEPTGNLDAEAAEEVLEILKQLNEQFQKTIIIVTHDPRAASYAKRELHLEKGRLLDASERLASEVAT